MKIVETYSHLNGLEFLLVHQKAIWNEIKTVIENVNANNLRKKVSNEKTQKGKKLFSPVEINKAFCKQFKDRNWSEKRYSYLISTDYQEVQEMIPLTFEEQKEYMKSKGNTSPLYSYNQTDFVKNSVAVEIQFGKYAFVAYDLFVKHLLFYSGRIIDVGIEILPMKIMQKEMSSGIGYFEGEVFNVLRHGRNTPAIPLVIIGIAP